jgi:hypothetical protein
MYSMNVRLIRSTETISSSRSSGSVRSSLLSQYVLRY